MRIENEMIALLELHRDTTRPEVKSAIAKVIHRLSDYFCDEFSDIRREYETQGKISAIKLYRTTFTTSLTDSKKAVEELAERHCWKKP